MFRSARPTLLAAAALGASLLPAAGAYAAWAPTPYTALSSSGITNLIGFSAARDRPTVLVDRAVHGEHRLQIRIGDAHGHFGSLRTVATSRNSFEGGGLATTDHADDRVAAWLEIVNGSRRPVVATGAGLQHRQVLAPGPRSTQVMAFAANRDGDAVVAYWRYRGNGAQVYASYRAAGGSFGVPQLIGSGQPDFPVVTMDGDGNAAVAYLDQPARDKYVVAVAQRPANAQAFAPAAAVPGSEGAAFAAPALAAANGRLDVAWVAHGRLAVRAAQRPAGATAFGPTATLAPSAGATRIGARGGVALTESGPDTLLAWTQGATRTSTRDIAALAVGRGGTWTWPVVRAGHRGYHVGGVGFLAPTDQRPPLLLLTNTHSGDPLVQTATIGDGNTLAPSRDVHGLRIYGDGPFAQGTRFTWLAGTRNDLDTRRSQILVLRSS
jgi:hypothetical protein